MSLIPLCCRTIWAIWENGIYDLSDYFNTLTLNGNAANYKFLDPSITQFWQQQGGQDITTSVNEALAAMNPTTAAQTRNCLQNVFYRGITDFRTSPRCVVPNALPLAFSGIICLIIVIKCKRFFCASQLGCLTF